MLTRQGAYDQSAQQEIINTSPWLNPPTLVPGDFTINPNSPGLFRLSKGSAAAITLPAPRAGTDDYKQIAIVSDSAFAHVITATGLLKTGAAAVNTATFAAFVGANVVLMAFNGLWYAISSAGNTFA